MAAADTVRRFADAVNNHDLEALTALWTQDAVIHDPAVPQPITGKEAIRQNLDTWLKAFPDMTFQVMDPVLAEGESAGFQVDISGTHTGPFTGPQGTIAPTNNRMQLTGVGFWRLTGQGLIAEERRYYDTAGLMRQLGVTPGSS